MKTIMKIKDIMLMAAVATSTLTGCGSKESKLEGTDFVDDVKVALADSGRIDLSKLQWTREPKAFDIKGDTIAITTAPHTDLWQRTYYHFQNDNAPVLQMKTKEKYFSFVVKTDFTKSHQRFDQFGIYACSPEESSFTALFTDMKITECAWKAHDGQQPDE